jgi:hypothetical protein
MFFLQLRPKLKQLYITCPFKIIGENKITRFQIAIKIIVFSNTPKTADLKISFFNAKTEEKLKRARVEESQLDS